MSTILYRTGRLRFGALSLAPCLVLAAGCPADTTATTDSSTGSTATSDTTAPDPTTGTTGTTITDAPTTTEAPTTDPLTSSTTAPVPDVCGDGVVAETEICDDGNDEPDDGCNKACEQTGAVEWTYTHNGAASKYDSALGVAIDATGKIILVGYESDAMNKTDMLIIALGPDGKELWKKTIKGAAGLNDSFSSVVLDDAGNIYACGYEETEKDITDAVVRAFDPDGGELWAYNDPPPAADFSHARDLVLAGGALYSAGSDDLLDLGTQLVVRRHDLGTGETAWKTTTQADNFRAAGQAITVSGATIVAVGNVSADNNVARPLVVTLTEDGDILAANVEDSSGGVWYDAASIGDAGDLVLAGRLVPPGVTGADIAVRRVGPDLFEKWTQIEDHDFLYDSATGVAVGPGEAIFVSGRVIKTAQFTNVWGGRYTGDGAQLWSHTYNNPDIELSDDGLAAGFGPDFVILAGSETVLGEGTNVWVRRFTAD